MSRLHMYIAGSAFLANVVLMRAYYERPNFYSAAVYISQSTGSLMFLINLALIITASIGYGLQRLFYGPLRPIETEQLYDKAWFAVSETLLAMTIFRDDIGLWFFTMFLCLLAGKVWQWIGEGRVEFLEQQPPANPRLFHTRLMSSLLLSVAFDIFMANYCIDAILSDARAGVMVMFGFEYVLLAIASVSTLLRYSLALVELYIIHVQEKTRDEQQRQLREQAEQRREDAAAAGSAVPTEAEDEEEDDDVPGWEEKGRWVFYLDLTTDFIKSVVYMVFFMILMAFYGIPIHIMRDLFMTFRSFFKRVHDFIQYRNATKDMNTRYPDATAEDLERENTCIVCREEMRPWTQPGEDAAQPGRRVDERQRAKKLPCGHILHFSCLRSWLERQQVCPTCRRPVLGTPPSTTTPAPHGQQDAAARAGGAAPGVFPGQGGNVQQPAPGQPGQPAPQGGQQARPQGNMRTFNLGPLRLTVGNLRLPPQNQQGNGNVANNNDNDAIANLVQQLQAPQQQNQQRGTPTSQGTNSNMNMPAIPGAVSQHPASVQTDILRIQHNIIESMRQLNAQHGQLQYLHALLAELNRLQQASGIAAATGQDLPAIAPLNSQYVPSVTPHAYFANGNALRPGDAGLPQGVVLPEGWSLTPMAMVPSRIGAGTGAGIGASSSSTGPTTTQAAPGPVSASPAVAPTPGYAAASPSPASQALPLSAALPPQQPTTTAPHSGSSSRADTTLSSAKQAEPSSLESSWSFGNVGGSHDAEGSGSGSSSTANETAARRTATVEDEGAEDGAR